MKLSFREPALEAVARRLPPMEGSPIRVRFLPDLTARKGQVESGTGRGREVHAASFLRRREMVLDRDLLGRRSELGRIFIHELFHFAWLRLANRGRRAYEQLLEAEFARGARGELGWSAEAAKERLTAGDRRERTRRWREYICESYCDTAAWMLGGLERHEEFTLAGRFRQGRRRWFEDHLARNRIAL